ncbi:type II toxin-antitoxin system VapC family toxin [Gracilimonas sediminicola]|uniref:Type II toxin-antitoxin system VapC family toxin n=1 Tax=Gracilimonas sediminicola TaxID=2952158 RepID=A0A9X2L2Y4_9BACT|nr:type II toxin-antitoxin system VapC family toxin [Gracilimonas sediminicola]MCP9291338.1 type II toxin-antitoxin system VapC family toxin [Gracilimonas sediminicola]
MRVYLDTSIFGGFFDKEFRKETKRLFELFEQEKLSPVISAITVDELYEGAPERVIQLLTSLKATKLETLELTENCELLADKYIEEKVVSEKYFEDALHVAISTVYKVDVLVSWNFKHIVNLNRIEGFNIVNNSLNYDEIEIRSPKEFYYG